MKGKHSMRHTLSQKKSLESAVTHYQRFIGQAEEYLASRGLTLQDVDTHRLGVVDEPLPGHENYKGRLVIPYLTKTGVVDIRFRAMGESDVKYLGLPGAKTHLYNVLSTFNAQDAIAVCEGEIDTITLNKCGIPSVGVPGVNNWKKHYTRILQDFETVYVFADGDQPGTDFAKNLARELSTVTVIQMPDGEDVNSVYCKGGPNAIRQRIGL
jgi:DNA primase